VRHDATLQDVAVNEIPVAPIRPVSGSVSTASIRAREFIKTPGGAAIVHNTVLEQKHGSEYYKRRHLLEMVKVLSLTTMEQAESIQQLSSRVAKLESELEKVEPLRQLLQLLDETASSDSMASSIISLLQQARPPTNARSSGTRPTTAGSIGARTAQLSATDFMDSQSKPTAGQSDDPAAAQNATAYSLKVPATHPSFAGGVDLLKLRSDGPSSSISSETETNSSDKARFVSMQSLCFQQPQQITICAGTAAALRSMCLLLPGFREYSDFLQISSWLVENRQ
jgi:hypothetical protein